jgi:hypothetical protein
MLHAQTTLRSEEKLTTGQSIAWGLVYSHVITRSRRILHSQGAHHQAVVMADTVSFALLTADMAATSSAPRNYSLEVEESRAQSNR